MAGIPSLQDFKERLGRLADAKGASRVSIAIDCGVDATNLSKFLKVTDPYILPGYGLANLAHYVGDDVAATVATGEYHRLKAKISDQPKVRVERETEEQATERYRDEGLRRELEAYREIALRPTGVHSSVQKTKGLLTNWREWLAPLTVFVGDRRDTPPQTAGDILALPAATGDLQFLPRLQLPPDTEIRSDKTIFDPETLGKLVEDRNLLILGSPAANLIARAINNGSCFSFRNEQDAMTYDRTIRERFEDLTMKQLMMMISPNGPIPEELETMARLRNYVLTGFAQRGILDPVKYVGLRARSSGDTVDFCLVSLAKHPWSDDRVAIVAAGIGGAGTAGAVQMLAEPGAFEKHPLGGVIKVYKNPRLPWALKYSQLDPQWDSPEHTVPEYKDAVKKLVAAKQAPEFWEPNRVLDLLESLK
jgi:hypothetical protein